MARRRRGALPAAPDEPAVRDAVSVIRRDYYADVAAVADSVEERMRSEADVMDIIHEEVDASQRVMYTWQARLGLLASENEDAYFEEFEEEGAVHDGGIDYSRLMFAAMERDVIEELQRRGVDV
jgi:hypothetical protein